MLRNSKNIPNSQYFYDLADKIDNIGYLSDDVGVELDNLVNDDYVIGIHKTSFQNVDEIFNKGLINNGKHAWQVIDNGERNISDTVELCYDSVTLILKLKKAHEYKDAKGSFIIRIPKADLAKNDGIPQPIYIIKDGYYYLKPEFVYGYIPVDKNDNLGKIIHNPNYGEKSISLGEEIYDYSVVSAAKKELYRYYKYLYDNSDKEMAEYIIAKFLTSFDVNLLSDISDKEKIKNYIEVYKMIFINHDNQVLNFSQIAKYLNEFQEYIDMISVNNQGIKK